MSLIDRFNVLVVEDNDEKLDFIRKELTKFNEIHEELELYIQEAQNYNEYTTTYESCHFDIIILDLCIPIGKDNDPSFIVSSSIYSAIKKSSSKKPFIIIGLTSYSKEKYQEHFCEDHMFKIFNYKEKDWLNYLNDVVGFIQLGKASLKYHFDNGYNSDILIVTARKNNEFDPVVETIPWVRDHHEEDPLLTKDNKYNCFGKILDNNNKLLSVRVVCLGEMGLSSAAALTSRLITEYRPRIFAMLGMCCGFNELNMLYQSCIGDIIVAKDTACWDEGRYFEQNKECEDSSPFYFSPKTRSIDDSTVKNIESYIESEWGSLEKKVSSFYQELPELDEINEEIGNSHSISSNFHFGLMLSGSSVIDNQKKIDEIKSRYSLAKGLDMEAHSVYTSIDLMTGAKPKGIVIKGVADYGDGNKHKSAQKAASLIVFLELLHLLSD